MTQSHSMILLPGNDTAHVPSAVKEDLSVLLGRSHNILHRVVWGVARVEEEEEAVSSSSKSSVLTLTSPEEAVSPLL